LTLKYKLQKVFTWCIGKSSPEIWHICSFNFIWKIRNECQVDNIVVGKLGGSTTFSNTSATIASRTNIIKNSMGNFPTFKSNFIHIFQTRFSFNIQCKYLWSNMSYSISQFIVMLYLLVDNVMLFKYKKKSNW
jgi:hypothetical protein